MFPDDALDIANIRERAAYMLTLAAPLAQLEMPDARRLIAVMQPVVVSAGTVLMQEGEATDTDYMALLLEGDVRAESGAGVSVEDVVVSVIGPGTLIGEMGLLDGSPRSATCTALTDLKLATLTREALMGLVDHEPALAARLLLGISKGLADRLRESNRRFSKLTQVTRALQNELSATHSVNRRLLDDNN